MPMLAMATSMVSNKAFSFFELVQKHGLDGCWKVQPLLDGKAAIVLKSLAAGVLAQTRRTHYWNILGRTAEVDAVASYIFCGLTLSSSSLARDQVVGCTSRDNMRSKGMYNASLPSFSDVMFTRARFFNENVVKM